MNFTLDDLDKIVSRCKPKNIRSYITLNTIVYNHDLSIVKRIVNDAKKAGITAIIAGNEKLDDNIRAAESCPVNIIKISQI